MSDSSHQLAPVLKVLRTLFLLRRIYFIQTLPTIILAYGILLLLGLSAAEDTRLSVAWQWLWPVYAYLLIRTCLRLAIVYARTRAKNYLLGGIFPRESQISNSSVNYELDTVDNAKILAQAQNWSLYDAIFNFYRRTKYGGRYLAKQAYYTVMELQLNRQVPHIIFDSKRAKRHQFRYLYLQSQRLSLEGNFDDYFDVYTPHTYQIDTLSFITPEVMQALLTARDYDIELVGDKVLLYAPLLDVSETEQFKALGKNIAAHLNDNLDTYQDDRLTGRERAEDVTFFGRQLLKSPMKYVPLLILTGLGSGVVSYFTFTYSTRVLFDQISLIVLFSFAATAWSIVKVLSENRQLGLKYRNFLASGKNKA